MKKVILLATLFLGLTISSCSKKCDTDCGVGGVCSEGSCVCLTGYEGESCEVQSNAKFLGSYDTDYTGTGGLASSTGSTTMTITSGANAGKIQISVPLQLSATLPQVGAQTIPLNLTIQADVVGNQYTITKTVLGFSFPISGFNIPISIEFEGTGTLSGNTLNSTWTFSGLLLNGNINMVGNK
jgi:hypothetical protein